MKSTLPLRFAILGFILAAPVVFTGCAYLTGGPPPPPPRANWQQAPGFSSESLKKIAVIAEDKSRSRGWSSDDAIVRSVEDQFIGRLLGKGYQVSARSDVKQVLGEINFQQSGLTESGAARIGQMLNASAVLIVTINSASVVSQDTGLVLNGVRQERHTATCNMSARLISVEKAEILGITSLTVPTEAATRDDISSAILFTARVIADAIPTRTAPAPAPATL